jgi:hypothetical protein
MRPSAWIVSANVDHAIGAWYCTNGGLRTVRGAGTPVRPPAVCRKRTHPGPVSGSACLQRHRRDGDAGAERDRGRAQQPASGVAHVEDAAVIVDVDPCLEVVGEAEPVGITELFDRGAWCPDRVGGRLVVVSQSRSEWQLGQSGDGFGRDPRHGGERAGDAHRPMMDQTRTCQQCAFPCRPVWLAPLPRDQPRTPSARSEACASGQRCSRSTHCGACCSLGTPRVLRRPPAAEADGEARPNGVVSVRLVRSRGQSSLTLAQD